MQKWPKMARNKKIKNDKKWKTIADNCKKSQTWQENGKKWQQIAKNGRK